MCGYQTNQTRKNEVEIMINQTSILAYCKMRDSNRLNENETIVKDVLLQHLKGLTCHEISLLLNWSDNRVSGRLTEMKKKGWLVVVTKKVNIDTGNIADVVTLPSNYSFALRYWFPEKFEEVNKSE
jgi:Fic family protein